MEPRRLNKESRRHNTVIKRLPLDLGAPWPREIEVLLGMPEDCEAAELSSALPSPTIQSCPLKPSLSAVSRVRFMTLCLPSTSGSDPFVSSLVHSSCLSSSPWLHLLPQSIVSVTRQLGSAFVTTDIPQSPAQKKKTLPFLLSQKVNGPGGC